MFVRSGRGSNRARSERLQPMAAFGEHAELVQWKDLRRAVKTKRMALHVVPRVWWDVRHSHGLRRQSLKGLHIHFTRKLVVAHSFPTEPKAGTTQCFGKVPR